MNSLKLDIGRIKLLIETPDKTFGGRLERRYKAFAAGPSVRPDFRILFSHRREPLSDNAVYLSRDNGFYALQAEAFSALMPGI